MGKKSNVGAQSHYFSGILQSTLRYLGAEVVSIDALNEAIRLHLEDGFEGPIEAYLIDNVREALWRNGALGVKSRRHEHEGWQFVWSDVSRSDMQMPRDVSQAGIHSSMFDLVKLSQDDHGPVF